MLERSRSGIDHEKFKDRVEKQSAVVRGLNDLLSDEFGLFVKTLNYHWNIMDPRFHSLHLLFEKQYRDLLEMMDEIAERVRILGDHPLSTVKELWNHMHVKETESPALTGVDCILDLKENHEYISERIQSLLDADSEECSVDPGTEDLLVQFLRKHEKMAWILRSHSDSMKLNH